MIYTITLNPSLDYVVCVDSFMPGVLNRTNKEVIYPGGKGINVSLMLQNLGVKNTALGFIAGPTGDMLFSLIEDTDIYAEFVEVREGSTRINVKINSSSETEINARGPVIGNEDMNRLFDCLDKLKKGDYLVMSGNIPQGLPSDTYPRIMAMVADRNIKCILDTSGAMLLDSLPFHPFLIKPNARELEEIFSTSITTVNKAVYYAKELQKMGALNVLVSRGDKDVVLLTEDGQLLTSPVPRGKVINSVGAGDSMVAGFLAEYSKSKDFNKALIFSTIVGSATAFSPWIATKDDVDRVLKSCLE